MSDQLIAGDPPADPALPTRHEAAPRLVVRNGEVATDRVPA